MHGFISATYLTLDHLYGNTSFQTNLNSTRQRLNVGPEDSDSVLISTADSVTTILDDILVAYGVSQLVIAEDSATTDLTASALGVRIGEDNYIYITLAAQMLFLAPVLFEAIRTGLWRGVSSFDHTNIKSAKVAASAGGTAISDAMTGLLQREQGGIKSVWPSEQRSTAFENTRVVYRPGDEREGSGYAVDSIHGPDVTELQRTGIPKRGSSPGSGPASLWSRNPSVQYQAAPTGSLGPN